MTRSFIVPLAAAILAISSASTEVLLHPSNARGTMVPSKPREACSPERIEAPTACAPATRPPPGPPTWWPQPCTAAAVKKTKPRHAGGSSLTNVSGVIIAVLALAAVMGTAGRMMSNHRRPQPDRCHEEFRRVTVT